MIRIRAAICAAALAATAPFMSASSAHVATAHPAQVRVRAGTLNLQRALRGLVQMPGAPPGAIAIVQRFGQRKVYSAGVRELNSIRSPGPLDHVRLASTAKAFSAAVALSLVDRHELSLDDTISKWLPELPSAWGEVTLREALNHTSGLPDFSASASFIDYLKQHLHATPSPLFLLRFIARQGLEFDPGSEYRYSNTDNFAVALMAEAAAHRTYNQLLASQIYAPLRLRHTSLPRGPEIPAPYLHGYQPNPPDPSDDVSTLISAAYSWASGGLVSTPADVNAFIRGDTGARLFSRTVQAHQLRFVAGNSQPSGPGANSAGLGIFRYRTRCGTVYGHTGNTPGYTQFMAATLDGKRSATISVSGQITDRSTGPQLAAFRRLRQIEEDAVCAALS